MNSRSNTWQQSPTNGWELTSWKYLIAKQTQLQRKSVMRPAEMARMDKNPYKTSYMRYSNSNCTNYLNYKISHVYDISASNIYDRSIFL